MGRVTVFGLVITLLFLNATTYGLKADLSIKKAINVHKNCNTLVHTGECLNSLNLQKELHPATGKMAQEKMLTPPVQRRPNVRMPEDLDREENRSRKCYRYCPEKYLVQKRFRFPHNLLHKLSDSPQSSSKLIQPMNSSRLLSKILQISPQNIIAGKTKKKKN